MFSNSSRVVLVIAKEDLEGKILALDNSLALPKCHQAPLSWNNLRYSAGKRGSASQLMDSHPF